MAFLKASRRTGTPLDRRHMELVRITVMISFLLLDLSTDRHYDGAHMHGGAGKKSFCF